MSFIRFILFVIIIYFVVKWIRRAFASGNRRQSPNIRGGNKPPVSPPPYDERNVEDIQYKEVKKKRNGD